MMMAEEKISVGNDKKNRLYAAFHVIRNQKISTQVKRFEMKRQELLRCCFI